MIKRYSIGTSIAALRKRYNAGLPKKYRPLVNAGSKKQLPIVTKRSSNEFQLFNWGIIPSDSHDANIAEKLINARVETISAKQPFCDLLENRCLIPSDGFYVWKNGDETDNPHRVVLPQQGTFSILGLFHEFGEDEEAFASIIKTFTMITCEAPASLKPYNERMPLILPKTMEKDWIAGHTDIDFLQAAIKFSQEVALEIYAVSELLNNERNNQPSLIQNRSHTLPGETLSLF